MNSRAKAATTPSFFPQGEEIKRAGRIVVSLAAIVAAVVAVALGAVAFAASDKQPAPAGAPENAPPQYTHFTAVEFERGFLALAFGSDLRIGARPLGIRRFDHPIRVHIIGGGSINRSAAMFRVIDDYARQVPALRLTQTTATDADIELRLIDEKDFKSALQSAFGAKIARTFVARTDPQCMTSVKSTANGDIVHSVSFIIVDKGDDVFLDCAYHELLHAFGLSNHDQRNPWTTLNQKRMVGYLTVYDRALLTILYDEAVRPGMTIRQARAVLPRVIISLGLAAPTRGR
jgi:DUF2927 family protein